MREAFGNDLRSLSHCKEQRCISKLVLDVDGAGWAMQATCASCDHMIVNEPRKRSLLSSCCGKLEIPKCLIIGNASSKLCLMTMLLIVVTYCPISFMRAAIVLEL